MLQPLPTPTQTLVLRAVLKGNAISFDTPTVTPTASSTATPTSTPTSTPAYCHWSLIGGFLCTPTVTATVPPSDTPTLTLEPTQIGTATATATPTSTPPPTISPTPQPAPTATITPTPTPTPVFVFVPFKEGDPKPDWCFAVAVPSVTVVISGDTFNAASDGYVYLSEEAKDLELIVEKDRDITIEFETCGWYQ